jgi:hypothetical protein
MAQPRVIAISHEADGLAKQVVTTLLAQGVQALQIAPGALGDVIVLLREDGLWIDDQPVAGIFFRVFPDSTFSSGFAAEDRSFADSEIGAIWLAAMHLDSVLSINQYDAIAWFEALRWTVWHQRLMDAGIPVSPFLFGDAQTDSSQTWYSYASGSAQAQPDRSTRRIFGAALTGSSPGQVSLAVCGDVIAGESYPSVLDAVRLLDSAGIRIAQITTDQERRVLHVDTLPVITQLELIHRTVERVVKLFHAHLRRG